MTMKNNLDDIGKLVLRLTLGALILLHGIAKLRHGIAPLAGMEPGMGMPAFFAYGVYVGEVLGQLQLLAGFYARFCGALVAANMLFAFARALLAHLTSLNEQGGWALELQGMFLFTAIALLLMGPGRISINRRCSPRPAQWHWDIPGRTRNPSGLRGILTLARLSAFNPRVSSRASVGGANGWCLRAARRRYPLQRSPASRHSTAPNLASPK